MSTLIVENSDAVERAAAILGEYCENYIIIAKTPEVGNCVELRTPCTLSSQGLLSIGLAWAESQCKLDEDDYEFDWEEASEEDDDDLRYDA